MTTHQPPDPPPTVNPAAEKPPRCTAPTADGSCRWPLTAGPCPWHLDATHLDADRRADALDSARQLLTELVNSDSVAMVEMNIDRIGGMWLYLAELGAAYVRDGSRPGDEDDRDRRR
jgi:hypothetical protein